MSGSRNGGGRSREEEEYQVQGLITRQYLDDNIKRQVAKCFDASVRFATLAPVPINNYAGPVRPKPRQFERISSPVPQLGYPSQTPYIEDLPPIPIRHQSYDPPRPRYAQRPFGFDGGIDQDEDDRSEIGSSYKVKKNKRRTAKLSTEAIIEWERTKRKAEKYARMVAEHEIAIRRSEHDISRDRYSRSTKVSTSSSSSSPPSTPRLNKKRRRVEPDDSDISIEFARRAPPPKEDSIRRPEMDELMDLSKGSEMMDDMGGMEIQGGGLSLYEDEGQLRQHVPEEETGARTTSTTRSGDQEIAAGRQTRDSMGSRAETPLLASEGRDSVEKEREITDTVALGQKAQLVQKIMTHPNVVRLNGNDRCTHCREATKTAKECFWMGKGRCAPCTKAGLGCSLVQTIERDQEASTRPGGSSSSNANDAADNRTHPQSDTSIARIASKFDNTLNTWKLLLGVWGESADSLTRKSFEAVYQQLESHVEELNDLARSS